jgi:hypothetical protein
MYYQAVAAGCFIGLIGERLLNLFFLDISSHVLIEDVRMSDVNMNILKINLL